MGKSNNRFKLASTLKNVCITKQGTVLNALVLIYETYPQAVKPEIKQINSLIAHSRYSGALFDLTYSFKMLKLTKKAKQNLMHNT